MYARVHERKGVCVFEWHIGAVGGLFCGSSHTEGNNEGQMRASVTTELERKETVWLELDHSAN